MECSPLKKDVSLSKRVRHRNNFPSYICIAFSSSSATVPCPTKTLGRISFQPIAASSLFFFSCRFLTSLVVLFTDYTKPLESLNGIYNSLVSHKRLGIKSMSGEKCQPEASFRLLKLYACFYFTYPKHK